MARLRTLRLLPARAPAPVLAPLVRALAALGVTPLALSVAGVAGNAAAGVLLARGELTAAGVVMLVASAADMLDGALARHTGRASAAGALLDSTLDRISEAAVLLGALIYALDRDHEELAVLAFIAVVGSILVSYVRARAESLDVALSEGLFTRPERVLLLGVLLLFGWLRLALWILAIATPLTALQRLVLATRTLARKRPE